MHTIHNHQHINIFLKILFGLSRHIIVIQCHVKCLLQLALISRHFDGPEQTISLCLGSAGTDVACRWTESVHMKLSQGETWKFDTMPRQYKTYGTSSETEPRYRDMKTHVTRHVSRDFITFWKKNNFMLPLARAFYYSNILQCTRPIR